MIPASLCLLLIVAGALIGAAGLALWGEDR